MKKFISVLFVTFLALAVCISASGCNDEPAVDLDAVKITIEGVDVYYEYKDTNGEAMFYGFLTTPADFRLRSPYDIYTLLIDLGENPVGFVDLGPAYLVEGDCAFTANSISFYTYEGHTMLRSFFEMPTADTIRFHLTVGWGDDPMHTTQYGFAIRFVEEA